MFDTTEFSVTTPGKISRYDFKAPVLFTVMSSLVLTFCILGLIGNTLCAVVLTRMEQSAKNMKLLKYLTFVDLLLLVLGYVDFAMGFTDPTFNMEDWIRQLLLPVAHPLAKSVYTIEIYLTVLIAIQRCVAVARPLHQSLLAKDSFLYRILLMIVVLGFAFNIPHWLAYPPEIYWEPKLNRTWFRNDVSDLGRTYAYREVYSGYITFFVRTFFPMLILIIANIVIVYSLRRNANKRREMTRVGTEDKTGRTTAIILAITTMSIVTHFTSASVRILWAFWEQDITIAKEAIINLSSLLIMINSSSNFIFYCTFGKEFRKTMRAMCCT